MRASAGASGSLPYCSPHLVNERAPATREGSVRPRVRSRPCPAWQNVSPTSQRPKQEVFGGPPRPQGLPGVGLGTVCRQPRGAWPPSVGLAVADLGSGASPARVQAPGPGELLGPL